jgi:hypothetical protein
MDSSACNQSKGFTCTRIVIFCLGGYLKVINNDLLFNVDLESFWLSNIPDHIDKFISLVGPKIKILHLGGDNAVQSIVQLNLGNTLHLSLDPLRLQVFLQTHIVVESLEN